MSGESRTLPSEPSLRFLKLEAKRRLAAGEFPTLHGLGWFLGQGGDVALHGGSGPDASGALVIRVRGNRAQVVLTSRQVPLDSVTERLMRSVTDPERGTGTSP